MNKDLNNMVGDTIAYPGVSDRVKAAVVDSVIILLFLFTATYTLAYLNNASITIKIITFSFIFIFYDPIFTSFLGGTIGHMAMGIRVKRKSNPEKNILLPHAIIRYLVKFILGIVSLFTVSNNSKGLAIHDLVVGSIVLFKKD